MSKGKKILAVLLTAIMTVAMTVTAFAEGTKNSIITISGVGIDGDATVKYEQIIKENPQSIYGWQFTNTEIQTAFVNGWNSVDAGTLDADGVIAAMIAADMIENPANVHVTAGTINPSANFNAAVAAVAKDDPSLLTKSMSNIGTAENVEIGANVSGTGAGLYIVTAQKEGYTYIPMAAYMSTAGDDVAITAKGSTDQVQKVVEGDGKSVAEGDEVQYTVTAQYPYYSEDAENKLFKITDTLENATFASDYKLVVKIDDKVVSTGYAANLIANNKLEINFTYDAQYAGKAVVITYTAIAGKVSSTKPMKNDAKSEIATGATRAIVESDTVTFTVVKTNNYKQGENPEYLNGAVFTLYKAEADGDKTVAYNGTDIKVKVVATATTASEGANTGRATFDGLDAQGEYYVQETTAPKGYTLNETVFKLDGAELKANQPTVSYLYDYTYEGENFKNQTEFPKDATNVVKIKKTTYEFNNFNDQNVKDTKLSALPSTGGIGTTIFTAAGCLIMICAAAFLFASRRRFSK